jgi:hypothetical protein
MCHAQQPDPYLQGQGRICSLKVNIESICRVRSITFLPLKGFCKYLPQLFTIMRQCVMRNNRSLTAKVKVKLGGQRLT